MDYLRHRMLYLRRPRVCRYEVCHDELRSRLLSCEMRVRYVNAALQVLQSGVAGLCELLMDETHNRIKVQVGRKLRRTFEDDVRHVDML